MILDTIFTVLPRIFLVRTYLRASYLRIWNCTPILQKKNASVNYVVRSSPSLLERRDERRWSI